MLLLIGLFSVGKVSGQTSADKDILISFVDTVNNQCGYKNVKGDIIIPLGKYSICCTDTFKTFAIVAIPHNGFVVIDRQESVLYNVFPFDNGPDYSSDGLFRMLIDGKIGYADSATGKIIITPQFDCAEKFENGIAKVSTNCETRSDGEHSVWISDSWFYIDRTGMSVDPPRTK
ncbi:MAG: WG repeat-containing protein [Chitinophagales bacterium]